MKIASWNVNSLRVRLPQLLEWLATRQPDIVALQETKLTDDQFPVEALRQAGYHAVYSGQKTYNGVALLSRAPSDGDVITELPGLDDPQRRVLGARFGDLYVLDLYVPNGQEVGSEKYLYKLEWLEKLQAFLTAQLERFPRLVVLGDFNIAPDERDVHDPKAWENSVLFSPPERQAFQQLLATGLHDSFRLFEQAEKSYSWWDYRMNAFRRNIGLRIDHILISTALVPHCTASAIDREVRKQERPSDHAPVIAEFHQQQ